MQWCITTPSMKHKLRVRGKRGASGIPHFQSEKLSISFSWRTGNSLSLSNEIIFGRQPMHWLTHARYFWNDCKAFDIALLPTVLFTPGSKLRVGSGNICMFALLLFRLYKTWKIDDVSDRSPFRKKCSNLVRQLCGWQTWYSVEYRRRLPKSFIGKRKLKQGSTNIKSCRKLSIIIWDSLLSSKDAELLSEYRWKPGLLYITPHGV